MLSLVQLTLFPVLQGTSGQLGRDTGDTGNAWSKGSWTQKMGKKGLNYSSPWEGWVAPPLQTAELRENNVCRGHRQGASGEALGELCDEGSKLPSETRTRASANVRLADRMEKPVIMIRCNNKLFWFFSVQWQRKEKRLLKGICDILSLFLT